MNNTFSITRFVALARQGVLHDYKMFLVSLIGFGGALFMLLFLTHINQLPGAVNPGTTVILFVIAFVCSSLLYGGSAFAGFRTKEKSIFYLMNPASRLEKFLWEYISRVVAFMVFFPIMFWLVSNIEGSIVGVLLPGFSYHYQSFFFFPEFVTREGYLNGYFLIFSVSIAVLTVSFTGASIFGKHPLIKTLFAISIIFLFHLFLVYFFVEVLNFKNYNIHPSETKLYILPTTEQKAVLLFTLVGMSVSAFGAAIAFFKLKEKEV